MSQVLLELMEPEINQIKATVKEEVTREVTNEVTKKVTNEVTKKVTNEMTKKVTNEMTRKGIKNTILALKDCGQTNAVIKQAIIKTYHISSKEAEDYLSND